MTTFLELSEELTEGWTAADGGPTWAAADIRSLGRFLDSAKEEGKVLTFSWREEAFGELAARFELLEDAAKAGVVVWED